VGGESARDIPGTPDGARRHWRVRLVLAGFGVPLALLLALPVGRRQHVGEDFHVFWQAGRNFATGHPLYHDSLPGARPLKYPPFAAMVFTSLALFPLPVAGVLMSLANLGLWVAALWLTREILTRTGPPGRLRLALILGFILSAQYFLDNFHHVQMNEVTLVLALVGIKAYLDGRDAVAAAAFVVGTAIKITPIFFVAWLVIRGRRRAALAVVPLAIACLVVPLVLRGPSRGAGELREYYHVFLEKHQHGGVESYTAGQNIAALVSRMTLAPEGSGGVSYRWAPASARAAGFLYRGLWCTVLLLFLGRLVWLRLRRAPLTAAEPAMVFAAALLLSPITFTTHLVPLLYIFAAVLVVPPGRLGFAARALAALIGTGMLVCGMSGRDVVGSSAYLAVGGYSICAWTLLAVFGLTLAWSGRTTATQLAAHPPERGEGPSPTAGEYA
jgi:alpha-1,2-mannosyltransferase